MHILIYISADLWKILWLTYQKDYEQESPWIKWQKKNRLHCLTNKWKWLKGSLSNVNRYRSLYFLIVLTITSSRALTFKWQIWNKGLNCLLNKILELLYLGKKDIAWEKYKNDRRYYTGMSWLHVNRIRGIQHFESWRSHSDWRSQLVFEWFWKGDQT